MALQGSSTGEGGGANTHTPDERFTRGVQLKPSFWSVGIVTFVQINKKQLIFFSFFPH